MSFGDITSLKTRFHQLNFLNDSSIATTVAALGTHVDALITAYTKVKPPAQADDAHSLLQSIWCDIVYFKMIPYQKDLNAEEIQRRTLLYHEAIVLLKAIQQGELVLKDSEDEEITNTDSIFVINANPRRVNNMP